MRNSFFEKTLSTTAIFSGRVIDLVVKDVELPDGKTSKREIINHPGAVAVIAITEDKKILLVNQFRKALEKTIVEIPAGKLEEDEDPLECAKRELEEETGYKSSELEFIISFYTSPGFADEIIYLYFTDKIELGEINCDEDEFIDVIEATLPEAEKLIEDQIIHDAKTIFAIQYLKLKGIL
ncbi:NUDIX hydrolase [Bacillaceae bacterium IKA-2]|nr:NUDIX hydrolase [Bacillaceae bacterium IKA-2]